MKSFVLAFLVLVASVTALPQYEAVSPIHVVESVDAEYTDPESPEARQARLVTGAIESVIKDLAQSIRDAGLDPVLVDRAEVKVAIIPLIVEVSGFVDSLEFVGLGNIAVNQMSYNVLLNRLRFDVSLPEVRLAVGNSAIHLVLLGSSITDASLKGTGSVSQLGISGEVFISIGIFSGISIRSLELSFNVGQIQSDVTLTILGQDLSRLVNTIVNDTIPTLFAKYQSDINNLLEKIAWEVIDRVL